MKGDASVFSLEQGKDVLYPLLHADPIQDHFMKAFGLGSLQDLSEDI